MAETKIQIKVIPNARSNQVVGLMDNTVIKIRIKAKPIDGKANKQLIKFLRDKLDIRSNDIFILSGEKNRVKTIAIRRLSRDQIISKLLAS